MSCASAALLSLAQTSSVAARATTRRQLPLKRFGLRHSSASSYVGTGGPKVSSSRNFPARNISSSSSRPAQEVAMPAVNHDYMFKSPYFVPRDGKDEFWRKIPAWENVSAEQFMSWEWSKANVVECHGRTDPSKFGRFLSHMIPDHVPLNKSTGDMQSREDFVNDVLSGVKRGTMAVRIMPYVISRINWDDPRHDPVFRQFLPLGSVLLPDHRMCEQDPLHETGDSKVSGLIHRYPDKALFLTTLVCPTNCGYCTRAYEIGADTAVLKKKGNIRPSKTRWEKCLEYIENTPQLQDIVISGGDSYYLTPDNIRYIGGRLIAMPNIKKFRFASRGLAVSPTRMLDPHDDWTNALIEVSQKAEKAGKRMALHTHFNHPNEISWITEEASRRLREAGVTVRNQSVLLRGVNDDVETMSRLIRTLSDTLRIQPYYVYQCDMVGNAEHFRTPLQTILDMENQILGSIAGFDTPKFVVDLPGGGGKRPAFSFQSYDRTTGVSTFIAPAVKGEAKDNRIYEHHDPEHSLQRNVRSSVPYATRM